MKSKLRPIGSKPERVILSDILPYEMPLMVSNRHFYKFLVENKVKINSSNQIDSLLVGHQRKIIDLMFGQSISRATIPFVYGIAHKENDLRELSIIHPVHQLRMIAFYEKYKDLIIYYCGISSFSIRKPCKVARSYYYKDKTHNEKYDQKEQQRLVEQYSKEYETLKTYFVYKDYSNIHQFYESYRYHRCEKKYGKLLKFDISKCFDSVYTHTIEWAVFNKSIAKEVLPKSLKTFASEFDKLMSALNYGETSGIVIGPEFSRIFAEIILQRIDKDVEYKLFKSALIYKRDYEVLRYVDDYFVFYNKEEDKEKILKLFRHELKNYNLYVNDSKTIPYDKPIITEITIGKLHIKRLLREGLSTENVKTKSDDLEYFGYDLHVNTCNLITSFKAIIKTHQVEYKDVLNYTLASVERRVVKILEEFESIGDKRVVYAKTFTSGLLEILDFVFFLYTVSPRVNTTIKLCRILNKIVEHVKCRQNLGEGLKQQIFKRIYDDIHDILKKNEMQAHSQVETLYVLGILCQLGRGYWLEQDVLSSYFGIERPNGKLRPKYNLNYFSVVSLLWYVRDKKRYSEIREFLEKYVYDRVKDSSLRECLDNAELTMLFWDIAVCPYLDITFRRKLVGLYEKDPGKQNAILGTGPWFTQWKGLEYGKALAAKKSYEVY